MDGQVTLELPRCVRTGLSVPVHPQTQAAATTREEMVQIDLYPDSAHTAVPSGAANQHLSRPSWKLQLDSLCTPEEHPGRPRSELLEGPWALGDRRTGRKNLNVACWALWIWHWNSCPGFGAPDTPTALPQAPDLFGPPVGNRSVLVHLREIFWWWQALPCSQRALAGPGGQIPGQTIGFGLWGYRSSRKRNKEAALSISQ
ncbi:uncharacterized protein LOC111529147 [Piliocolobus tephrosceles]|uniref:uncharacterized protein LOC111529147 n=1 Tax=Piliocolobus tephrosceles TaxID=591936 RepID=UPI000C2A4373|nr:uncharacterized protein LOC111529147 [Piliocolobus tephrosceles]